MTSVNMRTWEAAGERYLQVGERRVQVHTPVDEAVRAVEKARFA